MSKHGILHKSSTSLNHQGDFLMGIGSILNFWGQYYRFKYSRTPQQANNKAVENDWEVVAKDIKNILDFNSPNKIDR